MSVGVEVLDHDHMALVGMVNTLFDGIQSGQGKDALGKILDDLLEYTTGHFKREEDLFAQAGYPEAAEHTARHEALRAQVLEIRRVYLAGATPTLSLDVMNFLKRWLVDHIQGSDRKYGPFLNAKGIR